LPEYVVAGHQYTLQFQVRQHGHNFLDDLHPELLLSSSGTDDGQSIPARNRGHGSYAATFTAPQTGPLYLTIKSSFGASDLRLYPVAVVARGVTPAPMATADRGRILFVAKGCNACHANSDLTDRPDNQQIKVGPELGGRRLARDYVIQKVKQPQSQIMPDLGLSDAEAAAIATFLSGGQTAATGGNR
jgi:cytochrome c551/c552